jgi:hypothetical protein
MVPRKFDNKRSRKTFNSESGWAVDFAINFAANLPVVAET